MAFKIDFDSDLDKYYSKLDNSIRIRIAKRLLILKEDRNFRRLKFGLPHYVVEFGQYRVVFTEDNHKRKRTLVFVGTHKYYERWLGLRK